MRKLILFQTIFIFSIFFANAQENKSFTGKVTKVSGIPIFLYSIPIEKYEDAGKAITFVETVKIVVNDEETVNMKIEKLVATAFERKENNKISEFDAIIVDVINEKVHAIEFTDKKDLKAEILKEKGVTIFFYSVPDDEYTIVADLPADFSRRAKNGLLRDKVKYMVKKSLEKVEKGEMNKFDAIIINPDDFTGKAIKFIIN